MRSLAVHLLGGLATARDGNLLGTAAVPVGPPTLNGACLSCTRDCVFDTTGQELADTC